MRNVSTATFVLMLALVAHLYATPAAPADQPVATIETSAGNLTCVLFPKAAPEGAANFIGLARGTKDWTDSRTGKTMHGVPLYDNTIFHRVIPEFMIQGGDPLGSGMGSPGYTFKNETWPDLRFDQPGRLAYANSGPDTNGSQFFITEVPTPHLNGRHTIFGEVVEGMDVATKISELPRGANDKPKQAVELKSVRIEKA
jgi:cyclophilin family peptidyl-prolyl cis-trans isomerase